MTFAFKIDDDTMTAYNPSLLFFVAAPNVYPDHLKHHGEGMRHVGFAVKDMDEVIRDYGSKGFHFSIY